MYVRAYVCVHVCMPAPPLLQDAGEEVGVQDASCTGGVRGGWVYRRSAGRTGVQVECGAGGRTGGVRGCTGGTASRQITDRRLLTRIKGY